MAKSFTVTTTAVDTLRADAGGRAEAVFAVTNVSGRPIRGMAKVKALGDTKKEWLSLAGETERDFAAGATQQFTANFAATGTGAGGAPAGKYPFRFDAVSSMNPDEDFTEGPTVTVEVAGAGAPPPAAKKFPLWIIFVIIGVVLLIGAIILFLVLRSSGKGNDGGEPSPSPTVEASPTPTREPKSDFKVIGTTLVANPDDHDGRCPVKITFSGSITVNKPGKVKYTFLRSDGATAKPELLEFDRAGSKTVETTWTLGAAVPTFQPFKGWQRIKILSPDELESDRANFRLDCKP
jgi:hypothetical protein